MIDEGMPLDETDFQFAMKAAINAPHRERIAELGVSPGEPKMTWAEGLTIIADGLKDNNISFHQVGDIKWGASHCEDHDILDPFLEQYEQWQREQWYRFREDALAEALNRIGRRGYGFGDLERSIFVWPQLRENKQLLDATIRQALADDYQREGAFFDLALLSGTVDDLRRIIDWVVEKGQWKLRPALLTVIGSWAGKTDFGRILTDLFSTTDHGEISDTRSSVSNLLNQLPMEGVGGSTRHGLNRLSGNSRKAWRSMLADVTAESPSLRSAVTEVVLWLTEDSEDRFAQMAALHINADAAATVFRSYEVHPSLRVRLRARAALELAEGSIDPVETFLFKPAALADPLQWGSRVSPKTWLNDARLEQLLINGFSEAARTLADEVRLTASGGEETLVAKLFERLKNSVVEIRRMARIYARETDKRDFLHISLDHRFIGKSEEGGPGLDGKGAFATDVVLIMRGARPSGAIFSERATFIQAKRMSRGKTPAHGEHYKYDVQQVRDLSRQTTSSFLLAVGPIASGVAIPVMPARLFLDRFDDEAKSKILDIGTVAANGRSLAEWLVDDVIGLWTGDPRAEAVNKARAGRGDRATLLVEFEVKFVPASGEDVLDR